MDPRKVREMDDNDIRNKLEDAKEELFNLRTQQAAGKLEDLTALRLVRKDIARYYTILREREIAAALARQGEVSKHGG